MSICPRCQRDHPPMSFTEWAWAVRDAKDKPPAGQVAVLLILGTRMNPTTGCGWISRERLMADLGVKKETVTRATIWALDNRLLCRLVRGHRTWQGGSTDSLWTLTDPTKAQTGAVDSTKAQTGAVDDLTRAQTGAVDGSDNSANGDQTTAQMGAPKERPVEERPVKEQPVRSAQAPRAAADPDEPGSRPDVERICKHLADRMEGNGSLRPAIGKRWRAAARLMLDKDARTEEQVHRAIDWCQDDEFWRGNIESMPTLRKQYDRLRLHAQRAQAGNGRASGVGQVQQAREQLAAARRRARGPQPELTSGEAP